MEKLESCINTLVENIITDYGKGRDIDKSCTFSQPDKNEIIRITEELRNVIFPGHFRNPAYKVYTVRNNATMQIEDLMYSLIKQIDTALRFVSDRCDADDKVCADTAQDMAVKFLSKLPYIREYIETDVQASFDGDPAAFSKDEIIYSYPGLYAIMVYRLAHELFLLGVPLIPRMMTEHAHSVTGIDIHPGATIGKYFFIDHGTGIVIGETTEIGNNVKVYQGVTLGALSTRGGQRLRSKKRHPTIEDNVTIYSGASILGGETVIGHDVVIGGNTFITSSVKPEARVSVKNQELSVSFRGGQDIQSKDINDEANWFYVI